MAENEAAQLERELEDQLVEQRGNLATMRLALQSDPGNQELASVCEELVAAIEEYEESLIFLKRSKVDGEALSGAQEEPGSGFFVGSKCRFRYSDGRWYYGKVLKIEANDAIVSFLTPTNDRMQMCKFFLQQRCRFGDTCRSSHGYRVQLPALRTFAALKPGKVEAGSVVLASSSTDGSGVWKRAEVEEWDETLQRGRVVFNGGARLDVAAEFVVATEHPSPTDESSSGSESEVEAESDCEEVTGIGYMDRATGQQTETVSFASWEKYTRGIASKMMAKMGYVAGTGLGTNRQGLVTPLQVRVLPAGKSLDFVSEAKLENAAQGKKKPRGGKRKRDRKLAEAEKAEEEQASDVFDFINSQLGAGRSSASAPRKEGRKAAEKESDGSELARQGDEVKELAGKVAKLEEMAHRNRKEKAVFQGVNKKLVQARKALSDAEALHSSMSRALQHKQQEKKWMKF